VFTITYLIIYSLGLVNIPQVDLRTWKS
jgi:hypothetical protein